MSAGILPTVPKGGKREGAGRPPKDPGEKKERRVLWLTDADWSRLKEIAKGAGIEIKERKGSDSPPQGKADCQP